MKQRFIMSGCLLVVLLSGNGGLYAQSEQRPENLLEEDETLVEEAAEEELAESDAPASNVVDVSEENFRRSMELRDQTVQRSPDLTTGSYSPGTGLQALDDLPEESQKHLRGQLREVIVENGPWTPEDAGQEYPFVASEEAEKNPSLERKEEAAWGEMVDEYHQREAVIHSNAARTQAASRAATAAGVAAAGNQAQRGQRGGQQGNSQTGESGSEPGVEPGVEQWQSQGEGTGQNSSAIVGNQASNEASKEAGDKAERTAALQEILNADGTRTSGGGGGHPPPAELGTEQNALELLTQRQQIPQQIPQQFPEDSQAPAMDSFTIEISPETQQPQQDNSGAAQDQAVDLGTEGVIAIEDLEKVIVDPSPSEEN